jgi:hypothetical protein
MHIDDFIINPNTDDYAAWMFNYFRMPAISKIRFEKFMKDSKLFCTYAGKRYRVTGASRMGDVWLATDFKRDTGYDLRVDVEECTNWAPQA